MILKMAEILSYKIQCSCGQINIVDADTVYISATCDECELCGTHGSVDLSTGEDCISCNKSLGEITIKTW